MERYRYTGRSYGRTIYYTHRKQLSRIRLQTILGRWRAWAAGMLVAMSSLPYPATSQDRCRSPSRLALCSLLPANLAYMPACLASKTHITYVKRCESFAL